MMLQRLIVQISVYNLFSGRLLEVTKILPRKAVTVAYEMWWPTRRCNYS